MEKKISLAEQLHDEILEMVIRLSPEQENTVFTEGSLVETFGVSKAPVREALIKLCSEGILKSIPRYGYVIVRLHEEDRRDIAQMRLYLELNALRDSFPRIRPEDLEPLRLHLEKANEYTDMDVWEAWEDNEDFHCLLASLSGNRLLVKFLRDSMDLQKRVYAQLHWQKRHSLELRMDPAPHREIYQAILSNQPEKALHFLQEDILGT